MLTNRYGCGKVRNVTLKKTKKTNIKGESIQRDPNPVNPTTDFGVPVVIFL